MQRFREATSLPSLIKYYGLTKLTQAGQEARIKALTTGLEYIHVLLEILSPLHILSDMKL